VGEFAPFRDVLDYVDHAAADLSARIAELVAPYVLSLSAARLAESCGVAAL